MIFFSSRNMKLYWLIFNTCVLKWSVNNINMFKIKLMDQLIRKSIIVTTIVSTYSFAAFSATIIYVVLNPGFE